MKFYITDFDRGIHNWLENYSDSDYEYVSPPYFSPTPSCILIYSSEFALLFKLVWFKRILVPSYDKFGKKNGFVEPS